MRWSFRVARVSGIDVRMHVTFALAVIYLALNPGLAHGLRGMACGALLIGALFACLLLHELGHT
ncbi:MAG TPA: peptidase M50, partial [Polyangiaceae bacterium]|nr:peptidase M50 [Polyangiaceae bacterium]